MRRVLSDYFNYDVFYVMNITDVDDKIIKRARQNHLYERYIEESHDVKKVLTDAKIVEQNLEKTIQDTKDRDKKNMYVKMIEKIQNSIKELELVIDTNDVIQIEKKKEVIKDILNITSILWTIIHENNYF